MSHLVSHVTANAERMRALSARIHETVRLRGTSAKHRADWEAACAEFHSQFDALFFPGGSEAWLDFTKGKSPDVEPALAFLEADPYAFRSGYTKQILWNRFKQISLSPDEKQRLESVALSYLNKRVRLEFWDMARYVRLRGSTEFWQSVTQIATASSRSSAAVKAYWLLLVRANQPIRRKIGGELLRARYNPGYKPILDFYIPTPLVLPLTANGSSFGCRLK
jgi:hypothetical protein